MQRFFLNIADISIFVFSSDGKLNFSPNGPYENFVFPAQNKKADFLLSVNKRGLQEISYAEAIRIDKKQGLKIYKYCGNIIIQDQYRTMQLNAGFTSGDLSLCGHLPAVFNDYPLQHPFDKILLLNLLNRNCGALLHACGVSYGRKGLLFVGKSGAGKSTLANLWQKNLSAKKNQEMLVLNDDRIALRKIKKSFFIYGTPWSGEALFCAPNRTPLKKVFFITHSRANNLTPLQPQEALASLLSCTLNYFWQKNTLRNTLDLYAKLIKDIPCFKLGFQPNKEALDFILGQT